MIKALPGTGKSEFQIVNIFKLKPDQAALNYHNLLSYITGGLRTLTRSKNAPNKSMV